MWHDCRITDFQALDHIRNDFLTAVSQIPRVSEPSSDGDSIVKARKNREAIDVVEQLQMGVFRRIENISPVRICWVYSIGIDQGDIVNKANRKQSLGNFKHR